MDDGDGPRRPHTGRRRNEAAQDAILDAAFRLLSGPSAEALTIDAIAAEAGVGRQTIYRWWPSKGAVVADALVRHARAVVPERDTGSFAGDLTAFFTDSFAGLENERYAGVLRQIVAEAQHDEHVARVLADFTAVRRAALRALLERGRERRGTGGRGGPRHAGGHGLRRALLPAPGRPRAARREGSPVTRRRAHQVGPISARYVGPTSPDSRRHSGRTALRDAAILRHSRHQ